MKRSYKFANSLVKAYGKQSIFYKYWIKILLYTLIPFTILCLTVYTVVSHNTKEKLFATATSEFEKSLLLLNNELSTINDNYLTLSTDEYITLFLLSPSTTSDFYLEYDMNGNIEYILKSKLTSSNLIKSIDLYSYDMEKISRRTFRHSRNTLIKSYNSKKGGNLTYGKYTK